MICVEGYKAFHGTMIIKACGNFPEERITGDWLYKPEYNCWYGKGQSFPAEICEIAEEE